MSYVVRSDLTARIPPATLTEALDDEASGSESPGLWDSIAATIDTEIDGFLARRYTLPLASPAASLRPGAASLMGEALYQRRGIPSDANPFSTGAADFRKYLADLASGKASLHVAAAPASLPISIISEPAGTVPRSRLNG